MVVVEPRVFVLNYQGHDLSDAERFGKLVPLTHGNQPVFDTDRLLWTLRQRLEMNDFRPQQDYILLSGGGVLHFLIGAILSEYEKVNVLIWNAKTRHYVQREVNFKQS
ncbi:MAG: hypothetical protein GXO75_19045 [Calditrichaeota bacterium]|nr:hypothetical protein [Calditrichota bacterium]